MFHKCLLSIQKVIKDPACSLWLSSSSSLAKRITNSNLSHPSPQMLLFIHIVPPTVQQQRHCLVRNQTTASNTPFVFSTSLPHTTEPSLYAYHLKHQASPLQTTESSLPSSYLTHLGITSAHYRILSTRKQSQTSRQKPTSKDHTHSSQHPR